MTPQQQADELVTAYRKMLPANQVTMLDVKNCALTAARMLKKQYIEMQTIKGPAKANYWDEVKREIEKI